MDNREFIIKVNSDVKNASGKRKIEETKLKYSSYILRTIKDDPMLLEPLLDYLEVDSDEFFKYMSGEINGNVEFYDQALVEIRQLARKKN